MMLTNLNRDKVYCSVTSIVLEAPNQTQLNDLTPDKEFASTMWGGVLELPR